MIQIVMIARSTLYSAKGGDTIQVIETARQLALQGVSVDIKLTHEYINYDEYGLMHFFNLTRPADILYHIKRTAKPFVVSSIMINYSEYDKYYRKGVVGNLFYFFNADAIEYFKTIFRWLTGKDKLKSKDHILRGQKSSINYILERAAMLLPNSISEFTRIKHSYKCNAEHIIVPNGIDHFLFQFNKDQKKDKQFVICVARIEGIKNQLNLIKALNNTIYQLIIIGAAAPNQRAYYNSCRAIAADNIQFIDHISQRELLKFYTKAKVHVLPSWFETTGLSSLEAAAMGCNVVITDRGDAKEYFGDHAFYCDPSLPESIFSAVENAAIQSERIELRSKITSCYTWQQAAIQTSKAYKKILSLS